jgi:hypothetical protein
MNPELKGHIEARLDKVHDGTSDIFNDQFFEGLTIGKLILSYYHK